MHSFITKCSSKIKKLAAVRVPVLGKNYINICICNCIINTTSLKLPNEDFYICHLPLTITTILPAHGNLF